MYEMQPQLASSSSTPYAAASGSGKGKEGATTHVRQRSVSNGAQLQPLMAGDGYGGQEEGVMGAEASGSSGLQRSNTAGKSLGQSLKRRFGSLRRKKVAGGEEY